MQWGGTIEQAVQYHNPFSKTRAADTIRSCRSRKTRKSPTVFQTKQNNKYLAFVTSFFCPSLFSFHFIILYYTPLLLF